MSIKINIATVDKTANIDANSVNLERAMTSQIDTLSFDVIKGNGITYEPAILDVVQITDTDGTTVLFEGKIVEKSKELQNGNMEIVRCVAKDYSVDLDRYLVKQVYENQTVNAIVASINTNYTDGTFTVVNVNCPVVVAYIAFNYEQPTKCLQQLADLTGFDWYVDSSKDIHFFEKTANLAPYNLTDDGGYYYLDTLKIKDDIKNLRNRIVVRGGTFKGASFTESFVADGNQKTFFQTYGYSDIAVTVDSVAQTVGVDNLDDAASFDVLYNFKEKALKWRDNNKPAIDDVVAATGLPHLPVIVSVTDGASATQYGIFEYKVIDQSLNTKQGARNRARAELIAYATALSEGEFETKQSGFDVGQMINVQSTIRSLDTDFIISRISSRIINPTEWRHRITLVTTKTYGVIEFLQGLLIQKDKEIKISADEVIDNVFNIEDEITVTDSIGTPTQTSPPYKWDSGTTTLVWNFGVWS